MTLVNSCFCAPTRPGGRAVTRNFSVDPAVQSHWLGKAAGTRQSETSVPCHLDVVVDISLALCRVQPRALRTEKRVRVLGGGVVGGDIGTGIQGLG